MKYLDTKQGSLEEAIQQSMSGVVAKDLLEAGGKYLKYSDLLLQKGRLMAKNKSTAMIDKEISKEMKKLGIKESKDEYERFFNSALKKFKIDSPADLKTDAKKKEFFNYVDKNYKAKEEELEKDDEKTVKDVIKGLKKAVKTHQGQVKSLTKDIQDEVLHETEIEFDPQDFKQSRGPISNRDVADLVSLLNKEFPGIKGKKTGKYKIKFDHMDTSSIAKAGGFSVNKLALALDGMGFSLSDKERSTKLRGIRGEYEPDNVDETLDKIREANVAKQKSMRSILADIWNMNEGKNPFEKTVEESPFDSKRQLKDPKKETMIMMKKGNYKGRVFVIDKKDLPKFERQGAVQVENKEEGFASDAQRRAAFAQGYKAKGKKGKKEEIEKDGKTATGQKPTKVEIEPEIK
mgnify:CR=1 FL=1